MIYPQVFINIIYEQTDFLGHDVIHNIYYAAQSNNKLQVYCEHNVR